MHPQYSSGWDFNLAVWEGTLTKDDYYLIPSALRRVYANGSYVSYWTSTIKSSGYEYYIDSYGYLRDCYYPNYSNYYVRRKYDLLGEFFIIQIGTGTLNDPYVLEYNPVPRLEQKVTLDDTYYSGNISFIKLNNGRLIMHYDFDASVAAPMGFTHIQFSAMLKLKNGQGNIIANENRNFYICLGRQTSNSILIGTYPELTKIDFDLGKSGVSSGGSSNLGTLTGFSVQVNDIPDIVVTTADQQIYTDEIGQNIIQLSGSVQDLDEGNNLTVKYSIEGLNDHQGITVGTMVADGTNQAFTFDINIDNTIPAGNHTMKIWVEDGLEKSSEVIRTFIVEKTVEDPAIQVVTWEGKVFKVNPNSGDSLENTSTFLTNNIGPGKPFYYRTNTYNINGHSSTFYDTGYTMAYIGNNTFRVVTAEGKAFDVNKDNGAYTDITDTFMINNFGPGKPFYNRVYEQQIAGSGPFAFHDFGSTMAYIGNNKIRVVTAEGKAFDVDKDTGIYTEMTQGFIYTSNFGEGKPFVNRTYTQAINGTGSYTFYDFGSRMGYTMDSNLETKITSPNLLTAYDSITLSGTVQEKNNAVVTISAIIDGKTKTIDVSDTLTTQTWSLAWDVSTDQIANGVYSNIDVNFSVAGVNFIQKIYRNHLRLWTK